MKKVEQVSLVESYDKYEVHLYQRETGWTYQGIWCLREDLTAYSNWLEKSESVCSEQWKQNEGSLDDFRSTRIKMAHTNECIKFLVVHYA